MSDHLLIVSFLLLVSPAIGSFITVLVDRLPRRESIVWPRSTCRACKQPLGLSQLIPVVSFLWSGGKCRTCQSRIPTWHLYIELAATAGAVAVVLTFQDPARLLLGAGLLWVLLALSMTDVLWFRLPDALTFTLFTLALWFAILDERALDALWGAMLGSGSFLVIRIAYSALRGREGLGMGDVKVMAGLGALVGSWDLPLLVLTAALFALIGSGLRAFSRKRKLRGTQPLPFGSALCAAGALIWFIAQISN